MSAYQLAGLPDLISTSETATVTLAWNGQENTVAIEGIVAHGPGGNQGKLLVI